MAEDPGDARGGSLSDLHGRGRVVSPSRDDPLIGALSEVAGGPVGRYRAAPDLAGWTRRALVASGLFASVTMLGALWLSDHCRATLWRAPFHFTHLCYSDIPAVYGSSGLIDGVVPYLQDGPAGPLAQPVGTGGALLLLRWLTPGGATELRWVFDAAALLLLACLIVTVVCVGLLAGRRAWDAALVATSPVVVFSGLLSLDLLAVALGLTGLLCFARRHERLGGVLLGLAIAVRPIEIVLLVAVLIVAGRRGRLAAAGPFAAATALGWLALNLPVALASWQGWSAYFAQLWQARIGYGSLWLIPQILGTDIGGQPLQRPSLWVGSIGVVAVAGYLALVVLAPRSVRATLVPASRGWLVLGLAVVAALPFVMVALAPAMLPRIGQSLPDGTGRAIALVGYPLVLIGVLVMVRRLRHPPRVIPVALLITIGWLLVSPANPVQSGIWLLPLIVASVPSWRLVLAWGVVEAGYASITWLYLYGLSEASRGAPGWVYILALLVRVLMLAWIAWRVSSLTLWPAEDVIRRDVGDDPAAGPLIGDPGSDGLLRGRQATVEPVE